MAPTHTLVVLALLHIAHAAPPEIALHNEDTSLESSVVRNWTLLCEDLCSLNLSGPACGIDCSSVPVGENLMLAQHHRAIDEDGELCETLCENGLGEKQCNCKIPVVAASLKEAYLAAGFKPEKLRICADICRFQHVTLKSCPKCIFEEFHRERLFLPSESHQVPPPPFFPPLPPPPPPPGHGAHRPFVAKPSKPVAQNFQLPLTTTDSTTPDWKNLCLQLCRNGTGGILCNCDLPPF